MSVRVYNRDLLSDVCNAAAEPSLQLTETSQLSSEGNLLQSESSSRLSRGGGEEDVGSFGVSGRSRAETSGDFGTKSRQEKDGTGVGERVVGKGSSGGVVGGGGGGGGGGVDGGRNQVLHGHGQPEKSSKLQTIAANEEKYRQMHEKARREAERRIQENAKRREVQFNEMFANVQNGIDRKSGILKKVDQIVEQSDRSKDKRVRALYQSWNEQVYNNIQNQIHDQLNSLTTEEIENRLNRKYNEFLKASNQKSGVIMNANIPSEDPGKSHKKSQGVDAIKVSTSRLNDPLKRSLLKIKEEKSLMMNLQQEKVKEQLGRECLNTPLWGEDMLQTTPYGHIWKEFYDPALASSVHMNQFKYPRGNKIAFENFPKGKKTKPDSTSRDKATFSLIQMKDKDRTHAELIKSGDTHGDIFLLTRGKSMQKEEAHAKGKNMFDLIGHTCYKNPNVTGGDMWMESRGKQRRSD